MIERRSEPRVRIAVRVTVSGTDTRCEEFSESVVATNLSRGGALLSRVAAELRCGDLIAVRYGVCLARFRIVWVLDMGNEGSEVAIHRLRGQPCPWEGVLPQPEMVSR